VARADADLVRAPARHRRQLVSAARSGKRGRSGECARSATATLHLALRARQVIFLGRQAILKRQDCIGLASGDVLPPGRRFCVLLVLLSRDARRQIEIANRGNRVAVPDKPCCRVRFAALMRDLSE
jgi:hypothetical protein